MGADNLQRAKVEQWLSTCQSFIEVPSKDSALKAMDLLEPELERTQTLCLCSHQPSLADILLSSALYPILKKMKPKQYLKYTSTLRWFDFLQHQYFFPYPPLNGLIPPSSIFSLQIQGSSSSSSSSSSAKAPSLSKPNKAGANQNQPKGGKKKGAGEKKEAASSNAAAEKDPGANGGKLSLCVGKIVKASNHPSRPNCLVCHVSVGEDKPRSIILTEVEPAKELPGRAVVVILNMKGGEVDGIPVEGRMLLAYSRYVLRGCVNLSISLCLLLLLLLALKLSCLSRGVVTRSKRSWCSLLAGAKQVMFCAGQAWKAESPRWLVRCFSLAICAHTRISPPACLNYIFCM